MIIDDFCQLLLKHDWYYDKSDDLKVWEEGKKQEKKIMEMKEVINKEYNGLGTILFNEANPYK